ncbi:hypothetical protein P691DRAFT_769336 [Macrolepiota fuliginosa MF-IS2]|uniref:Uncharacterized protein n=1 Tax=Macrolepiota fuliginosa MF-IS2 TaxID=1400762 RepID=A0A9P6BVC9_9AGAR|nr:hypothetical protein P691DRAFT_769336 [Macrolepiota fuliginosa MF-IS2]
MPDELVDMQSSQGLYQTSLLDLLPPPSQLGSWCGTSLRIHNMARKAKTKHANDGSTAPTFRACDATQRFLAAINQNHRASSKFQMDEYVQLVPLAERLSVMDDLMQMRFQAILDDEHDPLLNVPPQKEADDSEPDEDNVQDIINVFNVVGQWCEKYTPIIERDDAYNELKRLVSLVANFFDLIPGPHQCPAPPPSPPPCSRPHHNDEDIPMELLAPTRVYSEAASQTPAPSHEASMPPPPPAAAATSPAAAASIPHAGPRGRASYAGAAAKNLNPAAPPFVRGPPRAPAAQPPAQAQQPVSSKCSKRPFFATRGPSRRQFFIEAPNIPADTSLPTMVITANRALSCAKSTLKVDSARLSPRGITWASRSARIHPGV